METATKLIAMTCNHCGKKIAEIKIKEGIVSIICAKCGTLNVQETKTAKERQIERQSIN